MDVQLLSRIRLALTSASHYLCASLSIRLRWLLVIVKGLWLANRNPPFPRMARFCASLLALAWPLAAITGIALGSEPSTNWENSSRPIAGAAAAPATGNANPPSVSVPGAEDAVEQEFKKLMEADDAAQAEVDEWIRDNEAAAAKGAGVPKADLKRRIRDRFAPIREGYDDFVKRHPDHARGRVAYGSFLNDIQDEEGAQEQWEKALELNPKDPASYNNLGNLYGHTGQLKKAFECFARAINLNPQQPLYYHNLGDTVFMFRKDAMEFYGISEQQAYEKALELYSKALKLDPGNFPFASDVAQTYYSIKPLRLAEALGAWTNTLAVAHDEMEREGVYLHLARLKL
ncbi:MAG: tetratricopeptide repeat protein, partial [Verrucomicrobia bacterium]|nr:tetratricopeptide repeat protein [Verrucomicrobiota bacterium]